MHPYSVTDAVRRSRITGIFGGNFERRNWAGTVRTHAHRLIAERLKESAAGQGYKENRFVLLPVKIGEEP